MKKENIEDIRKESDMADPDVWKAKIICNDCLNKDGGGCDVLDTLERLDAQATGKCEFYIKKQS